MGAGSIPFHQLVFPFIKRAVKLSSDMQLYLLDDAPDLWAKILITSKVLTAPRLVQRLETLLELVLRPTTSLKTNVVLEEKHRAVDLQGILPLQPPTFLELQPHKLF
jgi:hypothetical protein